jgi:hypothetical protein
MQAMISFGVENPENNDIFDFDPVEQFVWKSLRWHPPKTTVINGVSFWRDFEQTEDAVNLVEELAAQMLALRLTPAGRFGQVRLGFGAQDDVLTHFRICWRRRASTSFQSAPALGFP